MTSKSGVMDGLSITNCFTNFKQKHLKTALYTSNVAKNRGEKLDALEISKRAAAANLSDQSILDMHVKIIDRMNESQPSETATWNTLGDLTKTPLELHKYRVQCTFCVDTFVLVPRERNLESNLESHCNSLTHLNAVARSKSLTNFIRACCSA